MVGFTGGAIPEVKVNRLLLNNVSVVGVGWGAFLGTHPGFVQEQWAELVPLLRARGRARGRGPDRPAGVQAREVLLRHGRPGPSWARPC